jgi:CBS domain containing-hemolysin-like protein
MNLSVELLFLFLVMGAFFAGFETGIISINRHRLLHRVRNGSRRAAYIAGLLAQPRRLLATTLVGNNICNVVVATLAAHLGARAGGHMGQALAAPVAIVLILVFGEYLPKLWFAAYPMRIVVPFAFVFRAADIVLYPVAAACNFLTKHVGSHPKIESRSPFVSRENIKLLARDSQAQGHISPFERHLINRVLELQLKQAWQYMTPLEHIIFVTPEQTLADCRTLALQSRHDRLPVFKPIALDSNRPPSAAIESSPTLLGILQLSDITTRQAALDTPVEKLMRPGRVVDMDKPADDLLPFMRANHEGMVFLRDPSTDRVVHNPDSPR